MQSLVTGARRLGLSFSAEQIGQFGLFYRELTDWNRRVNLTAITGYEAVQIDHFLDALTVVIAWQPPASGGAVIDVGAGGGLPGIPLKIAFPALRLTLVEATAKKAAFLRHLRDQLGLADIEVVVGRAEEIAHVVQYRETFDLVLARAVATLPALAELTLPFCAVGGSVVLHKKGDITAEVDSALRAITTLGGRLREVTPVDLPEFPDQRCLVSLDKVSTTPDRYPRRAGMPTKRPLLP